MNVLPKISPEVEKMLVEASAGHSVTMVLVSIKDLARGRFHPSRAVESVGTALRDFKKLCEEDPQISKNKQDFELYQVGIFDPITAAHHAIPPTLLKRAVEIPNPISS